MIRALQKGKACGPDSLSVEHLIIAPIPELAGLLASRSSAMLQLHYVPPAFTTALVIPIPKGKGLDYTNPSNYRGISISSVLSKVLELAMLDLAVLQDPVQQSISNLQGGFRAGYSTFHTSFILFEAINASRDRHLKCYAAFLDARKAFDTVWHAGLLTKLHDIGITGAVWHLLAYWYRNLTASVLWQGRTSRSFPVSQGVRQGAVLSPTLYAIFINDLLMELENLSLGISLSQIYCGCPAYADDTLLLANYPNSC